MQRLFIGVSFMLAVAALGLSIQTAAGPTSGSGAGLELLKSAVLAAVITGVVACIGFFVSSATAKRINQDKLTLDRSLADRRYELDERLTRQKAEADLELAERKFQLDRSLAVLKRKAEIAEQVLTDFFTIQAAFKAIRSPMIWAGEMVAEPDVSEDIIQNDGYGVIRRMREHSELFAQIRTSRHAFAAMFGAAAASPFNDLLASERAVWVAAEALLRARNQRDLPQMQPHIQRMRREAFAGLQLDEEGRELPDERAAVIDRAVEAIEGVCRPVLSSELAAEAQG